MIAKSRPLLVGFFLLGNIISIGLASSYAQAGHPPLVIKLVIKHNREVKALTLTTEGKTLATATGNPIRLGKSLEDLNEQMNQNNDLWLWNITEGTKLKTFTATGAVDSLAFSPDGTLLASGGKSVEIWNVKMGTKVHELKTGEMVKSLAFSPNGERLTAVDADGILTQWVSRTGAKVKTWRVSKDYAFAVAYEPKGNVLITGGDYDGQIKFWDAEGYRFNCVVCLRLNRRSVLALCASTAKVIRTFHISLVRHLALVLLTNAPQR